MNVQALTLSPDDGSTPPDTNGMHMTTTAPTKPKAAVDLITIEQAEGLTTDVNKGPQSFTTWKDAQAFLDRVCAKAPTDGTYHKCDVSVRWNNDTRYSLRYDAAHPDSRAYEGPLADRIRLGVLHSAGLQAWHGQSDDAYAKELAMWEEMNPGRKDRATAIITSVSFVDLPKASDSAIEAARAAAAKTKADLLARNAATVPQPPAPAASPKAVAPTPAPAPRQAAPTVPAQKPKPTKAERILAKLPPTDLRRRLSTLLKGAEAILKDAPEGSPLRDDLPRIITTLRMYLPE